MFKGIIASILGAIVVFIWSSISWMALPWHCNYMNSFKNDGKAVVEALKSEVGESGLYILPNLDPDKEKRKDKEKQEQWNKQAKEGYLAYISVNKDGQKWTMMESMGIQFVVYLIVALVMACLICASKLKNFFMRGIYVSFAATSGVFLVQASNWNWWSFSNNMTWVMIAEAAIGWLLAGMLMGKIIPAND